MNISGQLAGIILNNALSIYNNATLTIYSGSPGVLPATVGTAVSGTPLASWKFPQTAFPQVPYPVTVASNKVSVISNTFPSSTQNPTTGGAGYARATVWQWVSGVTLSPNSYAFNGGNLYHTVAGGTTGGTAPTVTSGSVSDGAVLWAFVQTANNGVSGHAISDHSVNTSGADIVVGTTTFTNGTTVTLNNIVISFPASFGS